jgi:uncharacterized protein
MAFWQAAILFGAALLGGMMNSVAGGGSFIAFPMLIFTGVPPINANATNTVALWPGSAASAVAYRKDFVTSRGELLALGLISLAGGAIGAALLLYTPETTFVFLVPYLLLVATLLFTFSRRLTASFRQRFGHRATPSWLQLAGVNLLQFIIAVYGGYFGGGIGVLMLAALALIGMDNIHRMNALKNLLATAINGVAVVTFALAGAVYWPQALVMVVGAVAGGYLAGHQARKLDPQAVRRFVIVVAWAMTLYFFVQG